MVDYIRKLDIELTKPVWYTGEELKGCVVMDTTENFKVRGIRVHLRGKGHVEWKVARSGGSGGGGGGGGGGGSGAQKQPLKADRSYLDDKITVWGIEKVMEHEGGNDALPILPRGPHRWRFQFRLPETGLPPSFESRSCTVRYYIRCVVDIPYASNPSHLAYFTIVAPYTDCMETRYMCPTRAEAASHACLCLPLLRPMKLIGTLERSAFCCGEHIKLHCQVANGSNRSIRISVRLIQSCCFSISVSRCSGGTPGAVATKEVQHVAFEYRSDVIRPGAIIDWDLSRCLLLPPMPPTVPEGFSDLMQIAYTLRVSLIRDPASSSGDDNGGGGGGGVGGGSGSGRLCLDFPFVVATMPFRIPSVAVPPIVFKAAIESVEGGMYVSPAFTLDQVYDGSGGGGTNGGACLGGLLYQPLYATVMKNPARLEKQLRQLRASEQRAGGGGGGGGGERVNGDDCAEKVSSV